MGDDPESVRSIMADNGERIDALRERMTADHAKLLAELDDLAGAKRDMSGEGLSPPGASND